MATFILSTLRRMFAVPSSVVFWSILKSIFFVSSLRYCFWPVHTDPSAPIIIGTVFTLRRPQHFWTSISRSRYLTSFSAVFLITLTSFGIDMSMNVAYLFFRSCIVMSGLLAGMCASVWMVRSHITVTSSHSVDSLGMCLYHSSHVLTPSSLRRHQCTYVPTLSCLVVYFVPANIVHPDMMWLTVSSFTYHSLHTWLQFIFHTFLRT